jgi:hypothetical protein
VLDRSYDLTEGPTVQRVQRPPDTRSEAIAEAKARAEAVATVLSHDLLVGDAIDTATAEWSVVMLDQASRWLERAA